MAGSAVEVWLWLLLVMQPANPRTNYILSQCDYDAAKAARAVRDGNYPFLSDNIKQRAADVRMSSVREVQKICAEHNIRIVTMDDEDYPKRLKEIENPPIVLFVCGNISGLDNLFVISAVGTRKVSEYSVSAAEYIISPLAKLGAVIVSGMAVGADTAAHKAALKVGGRTIGVLGCGILVNYPKENADLKRDMVENGGAIISELLPNTKSAGHYFPVRNRIISGLSVGTLVIEASERSGSLLTANHALEQGRDIFCIPPHDIVSPRYAGVIPLLREGAIPVYNFVDITEHYKDSLETTNGGDLFEKPPAVPKTARRSQTERAEVSKAADFGRSQAEKDGGILKNSAAASLDPKEAELLGIIRSGDSIDTIMEKCDMDFGEISEKLTDLELRGILCRTADGNYTKT